KNAIYAYSEGFVQEASVSNVLDFELDLQSGYGFGNNFYLGTVEDGLLIVPFGSMQATQILPNGPIRNKPFALDATPGQLWVTFGETTRDFNPYPLSKFGVSHLKDTLWTNISYEDLDANVGGEPTDLLKVTINPQAPNEVYMSSFQAGLLKIVDEVPTILYDDTNSPLDRIFIGNADAGIRLFGSQFDNQGNLWFLQSKTDEGLIKLTPGGQFQKIDISDIFNPADDLAMTKLALSR